MSPQLRPSTLMGRLQPLAAGSWQRFKLAGFAEPLTMVFPRGAAHGRAQGWLLPCLCSFRAGMLVAGTAAALPAAGHRAAAPQAPNLLFFYFHAEHEEWEKQAGFVLQQQLAERWAVAPPRVGSFHAACSAGCCVSPRYLSVN